MKAILPFLAFFLLTQSCLPIKKNTDTITIKNVQARQLICNRKEGIYLLFGGDYWFHALKKNETLNWNTDFMKSLKWDTHRKELLFAAHTKIEPFCSSMGILYRNAQTKELARQIAADLRKKLKAENVVISEVHLGMYYYTLLTYNLPDAQLKTEAKYREYYSTEGNNVMRTIFWSMESCRDWESIIHEGDQNMGTRMPSEPLIDKKIE